VPTVPDSLEIAPSAHEGSRREVKKRVVVGITGTGAIFGIVYFKLFRRLDVKTEVILSKWARITIQHETEFTSSEVEALATEIHLNSNLAASISSGSFKTDGMIIAPCSMKSLAAIRSGYAADLSDARRT